VSITPRITKAAMQTYEAPEVVASFDADVLIGEAEAHHDKTGSKGYWPPR